MPRDNTTFTRRFGAFSSATLISRILGYIRDALVAAFFGGGLVTDAFYAAFKVPNLLRRFLGEGSLTAAFVPVFTEVLHKEGKEEAQKFFEALLSGLLLILCILVGLGMYFAPEVAKVVAWGFTRDPEKLALTAELVRLTFPFLLVISLAALLTAVLNSCGRFFVGAVSPSGLSIGEIAFIVFFASQMESPVHGLAVSAVVGVAIHFLWQVPSLYKEGYHLRLVKPFAHPKVKTVFLLMLPTIVGLCADQINSFIDQFCASFLPNGSITALYNSNRVMQLPLALFGVAVASVSLQALSKAAAEEDQTHFKETVNFSLRIANFVLIPSFIGLAVLGLPIIQVLFEHGRFTADNTRMTYLALVPYALGLPAYSMARILASSFYARKDTKTPVRVALWTLLFDAISKYFLMWKYEVAGLAFTTAMSSWIQTTILFYLLRKEVGLLGGKKLANSFLYGSVAGLLMGGVCWLVSFVLLRGVTPYISMPISLLVGVAFYFSAAKVLKIEEFRFFVDALIRRRAPQQ